MLLRLTKSVNATASVNSDSSQGYNYDDRLPDFSGFSTATTLEPDIYPLRDSDLLDTSTTLHICNDADKISELHPAQPSDGIFVGTTGIPIEVLIEGLLAVERPVAIIALVYWSVG
jgi:hypothetical protein